jgi:hypothetical protein
MSIIRRNGLIFRYRAISGLTSLLAVGAALVLADRARAADAKVYPAATCTPSNWTTYVNRVMTTGSIVVDSQTALTCPAIGDDEGTTSAGLTVVRVRLLESTNTPGPGQLENTQCTVYLYSPSMLLIASDTATATSSGQQTITLDIPDPASGPENPLYMVRCTLTGGSTFYEYEIEER